MILQRRWRCLRTILFASLAIFLLFTISHRQKDDHPFETKKLLYPLVWEHLHLSTGRGGSWYIPPDWNSRTYPRPETILDAARIAADIANSSPQLFLNYSTIPRIIHQTWKSTHLDEIPDGALPGIERWLHYATHPEFPSMAYFMWNDEGVMLMMNETDPEIQDSFGILPRFVEKTDVFRIVVCNTIGGIYSDIDTKPLSLPSTWVDETDIKPWTDPQTNKTYGPVAESAKPVELVLGIEADTAEDSDSFWRMGYSFPVQLTQWTLASAINNGILEEFISEWHKYMQTMHRNNSVPGSDAHLDRQRLAQIDPLTLTGPAAITRAAKTHLERQTGLRWQALSGIEDGGRSKLVNTTLILPISGFSPGRGVYGNMGSKPIVHPDARVQHNAQGSWRTLNLVVEADALRFNSRPQTHIVLPDLLTGNELALWKYWSKCNDGIYWGSDQGLGGTFDSNACV